MTSDLHPMLLELAKVAYIGLPLSWMRYLLSALEGWQLNDEYKFYLKSGVINAEFIIIIMG